MISAALFLGLASFFLGISDATYPPNSTATSKTFCNHELCVETFASAWYSAMVVEHGFDVVAGVELSGIEAAMTLYNVLYDILDEAGLCDADKIAFTASRALIKFKTLPLSVYLEVIAHETGIFSKKNGLLDCSTAIPLAFDYFKLACNDFGDRDESKFESYMHAAVQGLVDFIHEHGLNLDDSSNSLANLFVDEFSSMEQDTCPKSKKN